MKQDLKKLLKSDRRPKSMNSSENESSSSDMLDTLLQFADFLKRKKNQTLKYKLSMSKKKPNQKKSKHMEDESDDSGELLKKRLQSSFRHEVSSSLPKPQKYRRSSSSSSSLDSYRRVSEKYHASTSKRTKGNSKKYQAGNHPVI